MKNPILFSMIIVCLFLGCKTKKPTDLPLPASENKPQEEVVTCEDNRAYYPMTKGSYWIYENSFYNSTENIRLIRSYDSCFILHKDTIVGGKLFSIRATITTPVSPFNPITNYQNAIKYQDDFVVDGTGQKYFSACVTDQILQTYQDPTDFWSSELRVLSRDTVCTVPAGIFAARIEENKYTIPDYENEPLGKYRYQYLFYAKNIGLIYDGEPYLSNPTTLEEKRLVRYHIE